MASNSKHSFPEFRLASKNCAMPDVQPPPGFEPLFRTSPFLDHLGPFFMRRQEDETFVVGLRVQPHHANGRGGAHGGLLMTLSDIALGYRTTSSQEPRPMLTTASITTDFAGGAKVGDWIEAHVDVHKVGARLAFANCYILRDGERIAHASGVFARTGDRPAAAAAAS
jgi:uncharacterized protein (TIGR00369 family)